MWFEEALGQKVNVKVGVFAQTSPGQFLWNKKWQSIDKNFNVKTVIFKNGVPIKVDGCGWSSIKPFFILIIIHS